MSALLEHMDEIMVALRPREEFRPVPPTRDREAWQTVRQKTREMCVRRAEKYLGQSWPAITAADVILASRMGDARAYEGKFNYRREALAALALGEAVEAKGRFLTDIANLCFMICEESAWTAPANLRRPDGSPAYLPDIERPLLDMAAARTGALMATVLHLHRDKLREISPAIAVRIEREITLRVIDPFINVKQLEFARARGEDDMLPEGVKECLTALLLIEREDRFRWGGVKRALRLMDAYLDEMPRDGGIPGGLGAFERGVGCIMEALELICEASGGNVSFFTVSALRNVSDFIIGSHISLDYFNCAGNCPAHWDVDPNLIYRCGELLRSDELCSLGAYLMGLRGGDSRPVWPLMRAARAAIGENEMLRHDSRPPMPMDYYLRSGALLTARTRAGAADGFFISIEGGANRMGGHADAGNVTLYWNGEPVLPDLGEIEYASQLAPDERAALWETQSQYHNLPVINGCPQSMGDGFMAVEPVWEITPERTRATLDISRAYPDEAGVSSWQRTMSLTRGETPCARLWEIAEFTHDNNDVEFNFITTARPYLRPDGMELGNIRVTWELNGGHPEGRLNVKPDCEVEDLPPRHSKQYDLDGLYDKWLLEICGKPLYRVAVILRGAPQRLSVCFSFTQKRGE